MSTKQILRTYFFASSSGEKEYQTLEYAGDGFDCSCECAGWCKRVQPDGSRSCKHTRMVAARIGDSYAVRVVEYSGRTQPKELRPIFPQRTPKNSKPLPERAFDFTE